MRILNWIHSTPDKKKGHPWRCIIHKEWSVWLCPLPALIQEPWRLWFTAADCNAPRRKKAAECRQSLTFTGEEEEEGGRRWWHNAPCKFKEILWWRGKKPTCSLSPNSYQSSSHVTQRCNNRWAWFSRRLKPQTSTSFAYFHILKHFTAHQECFYRLTVIM